MFTSPLMEHMIERVLREMSPADSTDTTRVSDYPSLGIRFVPAKVCQVGKSDPLRRAIFAASRFRER